MGIFTNRQNKQWPFYSIIAVLLLLLTCGKNPAGSKDQASSLRKQQAAAAQTIVLITIDTWRHDAWGAGGNLEVETPNLDQLASEGVVFANAFAHNTVTLPSHASILTGLYGYQHGIRDNAGFRLDPKIPSLAKYMKQAGYHTGAFVSAFPLDSRYGLQPGFDVYDDAFLVPGGGAVKVPERSGSETLARASDWLKQQSGPTFLWLHLYEPHFPYAPPEPFATTYANKPYLGEIAYTDSLLGPFFDQVRQRGQAMMVITADHGESLGEHGELTHGVFAYDATLKIPLLFWAPAQLKAGLVQRMARHVDILATLLDLAGLNPPDSGPGHSLFAADYQEDTSYFESLSTYINRGWAPLRGCVDARFKAIDLPQPELYNLDTDANELDNLALKDVKRVSAFLACLPDEPELGTDRKALSPEEVANLQALGYVTATPTNPGQGPQDPKLMIETDRQFQHALQAFGSGNHPEGISALEQLIVDNPKMLVAYQYLADFYDARGRSDLAIETMKKALSAGIGNETAFRKLALFLADSGNPQEAWQLMQPFLDSEDLESCIALGKILGGLGRLDEAASSFQRALTLDPTNPSVLSDLGTLALMSGRDQDAAALFEKALAINETAADAWNGLGVIRSKNGDVQGSIHAWERAIKHNPQLHFCYFNLALTYEKLGKKELAIERLQSYIPLVGGPQRARAEKMLENLQK